MKHIILLLFVLTPFLSYTQNDVVDAVFQNTGEIYFSFEVDDLAELDGLNKMVSLDHKREGMLIYAYANKGQFAEFVAKNIEYKILPKPGELIQPKMMTMEDYQITKSLDCSNPWDAYPTYDVYETMMMDYATSYPDICQLIEIGVLESGRKLLALKISDNIDQEEAEPKFLYTSSMHGDEIAGYVMSMHLIDHLLCNYGTDDHLTYLVNEIEIWINPLANPDGTYTNNDQTVNGATRGNANFIDLNRNYPDPSAGANPDGNDHQPETIAFMEFHAQNHFDISCNFHGGTEVVNYPWDTWSRYHADDEWWQHVSQEFADGCQENSPNGYMNGFEDGITNGYEWYTVDGGRQDYLCYFHHGRECTIELSDQKLLSENELVNHWEYTYPSLIKYMEQTLFGARGIVTDSLTGEPLIAEVFIEGHDIDNSQVFSRLPNGNYHRYLKEGFYELTFTAEEYIPKKVAVSAEDNGTFFQNVQLVKEIETSVNDEFTKANLSVYPNPTNSSLRFSLENGTTRALQLKIYNILGDVVFSKDYDSNDELNNDIIHVANFKPGAYMIELRDSKSMIFEKVSVY